MLLKIGPGANTICARPAFILSASAMSSADSNSTVSTATGVPLSMSHSVHDVIHAEFIRFVRFLDRAEAGGGKFPEIRDVGAVVDDRHQALLGIVVFEQAIELRPIAIVRLRDDTERFDMKERIEDRKRRIERNPMPF